MAKFDVFRSKKIVVIVIVATISSLPLPTNAAQTNQTLPSPQLIANSQSGATDVRPNASPKKASAAADFLQGHPRPDLVKREIVAAPTDPKKRSN